jgi:multidrug resistance efflux pump
MNQSRTNRMNQKSVEIILGTLPRGFRTDPRLGIVFDEPPCHSDDLTVIPGVETRQAVTLNQVGVYCLGQIALWKSGQVAAFAEELRIAPQEIVSRRWVETAAEVLIPMVPLKSGSGSLPASILRSFALLCCAVTLGFLAVCIVGLRGSSVAPGILSADITTVRVPVDGVLQKSLVNPGDEVYSDTPLFVLHRAGCEQKLKDYQAQLVHLKHNLERARARASLEVAWRSQDVERQIADAHSRMHSGDPERSMRKSRTAALPEEPFSVSEPLDREASSEAVQVSRDQIPGDQGMVPDPVVTGDSSQSVALEPNAVAQATPGMMFFSGRTGRVTQWKGSPRPPATAVRDEPALKHTKGSDSEPPKVALSVPARAASLSEVAESEQALESADSADPSLRQFVPGQDDPANSLEDEMVVPGMPSSSPSELNSRNVISGEAWGDQKEWIRKLEEMRDSLPEQVDRASGVRQLEAEISELSAKISEVMNAAPEITVSSPVHGIVGDLQCHVGDSVNGGAALVRLLHNEDRFIIAHVPARRISAFREGSEVQVLFPDSVVCRGKVSVVPVLAEQSSDGSDGLASVRIDPIGRLWPSVPIGTRIDVVLGRSR